MQAALSDQFLNRAAALVVRVDLNERLRPIAAALVLAFNLLQEVGRCDLGEAAREGAVLIDQAVPEFEDVLHFMYLLLFFCLPCPAFASRHGDASWLPIADGLTRPAAPTSLPRADPTPVRIHACCASPASGRASAHVLR